VQFCSQFSRGKSPKDQEEKWMEAAIERMQSGGEKRCVCVCVCVCVCACVRSLSVSLSPLQSCSQIFSIA
jgi:hypothetical protein